MVGVIAMIRMFFQSAKSLQWHSINPTTFQRNMASNEMFHALSGVHKVTTGRRWRDVTAIARLRTESGQTMSIEQVTAAWISLRRKHPAMASVVEGSKRLYHKADEEELQSWLKETLMRMLPQSCCIAWRSHRGQHCISLSRVPFSSSVPHTTLWTLWDSCVFSMIF